MTTQTDSDLAGPATDILKCSRQSSLTTYALLSTGSNSLLRLMLYELITGLFGNWPGAAGYLLRRTFYRLILAQVGSHALIGRNVTIRGAARISIGANALVDDNCSLDARGPDACVTLGDGVLIARNTMLRSRGRKLDIRSGTSIGGNCIIGTDSNLTIGTDVLIAAFCYLSGGGAHNFDDTHTPIIKQGCTSRGGITVGDGAWIGAHTTVLDGASIGRGAIVGANSMVKGALPEMSISYGTPAQVQRQRTSEPKPAGDIDCD